MNEPRSIRVEVAVHDADEALRLVRVLQAVSAALWDVFGEQMGPGSSSRSPTISISPSDRHRRWFPSGPAVMPIPHPDLNPIIQPASQHAANKLEGDKGSHLVAWVMDKGEPSAGLKRLIATDLVTSPNKGKAIAKWRERSELGDFSCASLESIYPGSTGQPL